MQKHISEVSWSTQGPSQGPPVVHLNGAHQNVAVGRWQVNCLAYYMPQDTNTKQQMRDKLCLHHKAAEALVTNAQRITV